MKFIDIPIGAWFTHNDQLYVRLNHHEDGDSKVVNARLVLDEARRFCFPSDTEVVVPEMEQRYTYAKHKALAAAVLVQQFDFAETLDIALQAAITSEDGITIGRAVEMFERFIHYMECLGKYYARNLEIMRKKKDA